MKADQGTVFWTLALWGLSATLARAALAPPYDFAGHWSGTATARGTGQTGALTVDFTATPKPRKFTGSATLDAGETVVCAFTAKYRKKLVLHPRCGGRPSSPVFVQFDPETEVLTGSFPIGRHHKIADFTLTRMSG